MSGLAATEPKWEGGRINVLLGQGQTAQVLRNLCYHVFEQPDPKPAWTHACRHIESLFGAQLRPPQCFDHYYQADLKGWVLYLEGSTDLAVLRAFAHTFEHPVAQELDRPFVQYLTTNLPSRARDHFFALQEARTDSSTNSACPACSAKRTTTCWPVLPKEKLEAEVTVKLDAILAVAQRARPNGD